MPRHFEQICQFQEAAAEGSIIALKHLVRSLAMSTINEFRNRPLNANQTAALYARIERNMRAKERAVAAQKWQQQLAAGDISQLKDHKPGKKQLQIDSDADSIIPYFLVG